ncbi:unnamed protein product, partial [Didymodactylos carnosus]
NQILSSGTSLLAFTNACAATSWFQVAWLYTAQSSNETLTLAAYNAPAWTWIDDISVIDTSNSHQLLINGDWENGTLMTGWQGTNVVTSNSCHGGTWCYYQGASTVEYTWQSFTTVPGTQLNMSFWIMWTGSGSAVYTNITITP